MSELIKAYYVKRHDNQPFSGETIRDWIIEWLTPDQVPTIENDPITAIRQGLSFKDRASSGLITKIFGSFPISELVLDHFVKYPMRVAFGADPWDLLQGYIRSPDPVQYFVQWTGEPYENFLNETERIFYLTRGYGVPNPNISEEDLVLRRIYQKASPTALIALSDIFEVCAARQDPLLIREFLTCYPLNSIDKFHRKIVEEISECLLQERLCTPTCTPERVECYKRFLDSKGILPVFEYDPHFNVFVSNISELGLYKRVTPDKIWDPNEVTQMHSLYVEGILDRLSDRELLKIGATTDISSIEKRLRSVLLADALTALLTPRWARSGNSSPNGNSIIYGRAIDTPKQFTLEQFINSIRDNQALIDPAGNVLDYESAMGLQIPELEDWVYRTQIMELENRKQVARLPHNQKEIPEQFILWSKWDYPNKWIPVARRFSDGPVPDDLLESTLEYYRQIFPR